MRLQGGGRGGVHGGIQRGPFGLGCRTGGLLGGRGGASRSAVWAAKVGEAAADAVGELEGSDARAAAATAAEDMIASLRIDATPAPTPVPPPPAAPPPNLAPKSSEPLSTCPDWDSVETRHVCSGGGGWHGYAGNTRVLGGNDLTGAECAAFCASQGAGCCESRAFGSAPGGKGGCNWKPETDNQASNPHDTSKVVICTKNAGTP